MKTKSITLEWTIEIPTAAGNYIVRDDIGNANLVAIREYEGEMQWRTGLGLGRWYPILKDEKQEWAGPIL